MALNVLNQKTGDGWSIYNADCVEFTAGLPDNSIDLSVYSPPFSSLYIYSESERDMGNVSSHEEFFESYRHLVREKLRVTRPGRLTAIHIKDLVYYSNSSEKGDRGIYDFTAGCSRVHVEEGWTLHRKITVNRCPVKEMQKTKADRLLYKHFREDAARTGGGLPEYIYVFRKWADGMDDVAPVLHPPASFPLEVWQEWAQPVWFGLPETDVLNVGAKTDEERHLCLATGSEVLTIEGFKPIESVEIGDMVLTHKGRWRPVTGKKFTGVRPVVTVRAQGVPGLTLTPDHKLWTRLIPTEGKWFAIHARERAKNVDPQWVRADKTLSSYLNLKLPPIESASRLSEADWWVVGRWLGDGHIGARNDLFISCGHHETDSLVSKLGDRCGLVWKNNTATQIRIKDPDGSLRAVISACGRGAANKQFPPEAFSLPVAAAKSILDGYLSADGNFLASRGRFLATSVSRRLLLGASMLFQRAYGVSASVFAGRTERMSVIAGRDVTCRQEYALTAYVEPGRVKPFILDDGAWQKVKSVEDAGQQGTWCLRVEEDESFTAEGCIVKNCPMPLNLTRRIVLQYTNPGEVVFSPFLGIGSEGYESVRHGRRFIGTELSEKYFAQAIRNLQRAEKNKATGDLFEGEAA